MSITSQTAASNTEF